MEVSIDHGFLSHAHVGGAPLITLPKMHHYHMISGAGGIGIISLDSFGNDLNLGS
jgi:hypothetical protein